MKRLTREQQKAVVEQWKRAAPALAQARDDELRQWQYDPVTVDALLEIGANSPRGEEEPNGLVEMQRWFMTFARKQGLLPAVVRESPGGYSRDSRRAVPARCCRLANEPGRLVYFRRDGTGRARKTPG